MRTWKLWPDPGKLTKLYGFGGRKWPETLTNLEHITVLRPLLHFLNSLSTPLQCQESTQDDILHVEQTCQFLPAAALFRRLGARVASVFAGWPRFRRSLARCFMTVGSLPRRIIHSGTGMPDARIRFATRRSCPTTAQHRTFHCPELSVKRCECMNRANLRRTGILLLEEGDGGASPAGTPRAPNPAHGSQTPSSLRLAHASQSPSLTDLEFMRASSIILRTCSRTA